MHNIQYYEDRLLELERTLSAQVGRAVANGRGEFIDVAHDVGEMGMAGEAASEAFMHADRDAIVLTQVRDALARVKEGTFGACVVDGAPIEAKRLEAVPWARYCLKHEQALEAPAASSRFDAGNDAVKRDLE